MTPYGAGLEQQGNANFNMDWQNQQLQRQLAALQGAGGASALGSNMMGAAPGMFNTASAMPYNAFQTIGGQQMGNLGQLGQFGAQAGQQAQDPIRQKLALLGIGNQATATGNQAYVGQLQGANQGFGQQQQMFSGLGNMMGQIPWGGMASGIGSAFGGMGGMAGVGAADMSPAAEAMLAGMFLV